MEYREFVLLLSRGPNGYNARVIDAPVPDAAVDFHLGFSQQDLDSLNWLNRRSIDRFRDLLPVTTQSAPLSPQEFGARLYNDVFAGPIDESLVRSLDAARAQGAGLRVRLRFAEDVPELLDLPWEYLYSTRWRRFVALSHDTPLMRYPSVGEPAKPLRVVPPLLIATLVANPKELPPLQVEEEWRRLALALSGMPDRIRLERIQPPTLSSLRQYLRNHRVHALHFVGHGTFDDNSQQGKLAFEDDEGHSLLVTAELLGMLFHDHPTLRFLFLNACEGARGGSSDSYAGIAQSLLRQNIPAVLAMQFPISDQAAILLAQEFYRGLANGEAIDEALTNTRKAVRGKGNEVEWGTPVLFIRSDDTRLFVLPEGDARPEIPIQSFEPKTLLVEGGPFWMGRDAVSNQDLEAPRHQASLPLYRMGEFPVTNHQYAEFVRQTPSQPAPLNAGWYLRQPPADRRDHPVTQVTWYDAIAYCRWLSQKTGRTYRLPTEAEWEKAARGEDGRLYPWGDRWQNSFCNLSGEGTTALQQAQPAGASPSGCLDMLGNVQEWTSTLWGSSHDQCLFPYPYSSDDGREELNPPHLHPTLRVHRGGSFRSKPDEMRCTARGAADSTSAVSWRGFRVVLQLNDPGTSTEGVG
jgi:formylglycine-generating enzyme required for sulfatase activity